MNKLELLHEGFKNEVEELDSLVQDADSFVLKVKRNFVNNKFNAIVSNLNGLCDSLYSEFENSTENEFIELQNKYKIVLEILNEKLSYEDKIYVRIKYDIEVDYHV